ncbi:unnamed protein product [Staurois parvus]|uniref:Secreted protein n=1 Tax=Staurois parvus TaxID=386267 RepID=A0ABN9FK49_9NEOB|nr:unnamed protein product [Staurois parvus]
MSKHVYFFFVPSVGSALPRSPASCSTRGLTSGRSRTLALSAENALLRGQRWSFTEGLTPTRNPSPAWNAGSTLSKSPA